MNKTRLHGQTASAYFRDETVEELRELNQEMLLWLKNALGTIERGLADRRWLEGTAGLTIADIREVIARAEGREPYE